MKFCRHKWRMISWRLAHIPEYEPSTILIEAKCEKCGKMNKIPTYKRNKDWEEKNKHYIEY